MRKLSKAALMCVFVLSTALAAFAQEPNPHFNKELDQETPQQQKQEARKPDAKAIQNTPASRPTATSPSSTESTA